MVQVVLLVGEVVDAERCREMLVDLVVRAHVEHRELVERAEDVRRVVRVVERGELPPAVTPGQRSLKPAIKRGKYSGATVSKQPISICPATMSLSASAMLITPITK